MTIKIRTLIVTMHTLTCSVCPMRAAGAIFFSFSTFSATPSPAVGYHAPAARVSQFSQNLLSFSGDLGIGTLGFSVRLRRTLGIPKNPKVRPWESETMLELVELGYLEENHQKSIKICLLYYDA